MCYEYSSWFQKARIKEMQKAQKAIDAAKSVSTRTPPVEPKKTEPKVDVPEKMPA
jgi:hypothetical protein